MGGALSPSHPDTGSPSAPDTGSLAEDIIESVLMLVIAADTDTVLSFWVTPLETESHVKSAEAEVWLGLDGAVAAKGCLRLRRVKGAGVGPIGGSQKESKL